MSNLSARADYWNRNGGDMPPAPELNRRSGVDRHATSPVLDRDVTREAGGVNPVHRHGNGRQAGTPGGGITRSLATPASADSSAALRRRNATLANELRYAIGVAEEALEVCRKHKFVFRRNLTRKHLSDVARWEKLAFTFYSMMVDRAIHARDVLDAAEREKP